MPGDQLALEADAVVNATSEQFNDRSAFTRRLAALAGGDGQKKNRLQSIFLKQEHTKKMNSLQRLLGSMAAGPARRKSLRASTCAPGTLFTLWALATTRGIEQQPRTRFTRAIGVACS